MGFLTTCPLFSPFSVVSVIVIVSGSIFSVVSVSIFFIDSVSIFFIVSVIGTVYMLSVVSVFEPFLNLCSLLFL